MNSSMLAGVGETNFNPKHAVSWLEEQPEELQLWQVIFEKLLLHAEKPKQSSGNACGKLHGFVEQCSRSSKPALRDFAFAEDTALRLFDFFMEWNEKDSHRSMRLVLDFLTHLISSNPTPEVGASVKAIILNTTVSTITQQATRPSIKSAMVVLDYFIQKKLVYPYTILELYQEIHGLPSDEDVLWDAFIANIFAWMELHHLCHVAGKLLVTIFTSPWYEDKDVRHSPERWHRFIYRGLQTNLDFLDPIKLYIFVQLFKVDRAGSLAYLQHLSSLQRLTSGDSDGWDINSMLWLAMLEAGKKEGVVDEPGREPEKNHQSIFQLRADVLESVLCHDSYEARSSAVSLLIASPSTTKPYTAESLDLLRRYLPSFHEDSDPKMRYDVLSHSRNMIKRIQNTIESLRREADRALKINKPGPKKDVELSTSEEVKFNGIKGHRNDTAMELSTTLRRHEDFVAWYVSFLKDELAPTASYQRHITALKAMVLIVKPAQVHGRNTTSSELSTLLVDSTWFRSILDLVMDPFDDVRETAASLVMCLSPVKGYQGLQSQTDKLGKTAIEELRSFCDKADELARRTARADHSDGAARSSELLYRWSTDAEERMRIPFAVLSSLEAKLSAAEKDLATAVLQAPVHGSFASLRYIWNSFSNMKFSEKEVETLAELQDRAVICCQRIWQAVRHVLCDDSPEGHLPEELEEVEGLDTKDLLSYSFRAIHESSNLMRAVASNASNNRDLRLIAPSKRNFEAIGRLTFEELSNLRHRGAFTTVSQTFTSCCQLVKYFPAPSGDGYSLLDEWYDGALNCIKTQASTTRRSAGIPALIVGILSSNADRPSFEDVIRNLQDIGRIPALVAETDGSNLPQVHALNCIKDIFKSSYLSKRAEPYLTDCLQLAANSLKSEIWAIRNCGLLLLRSLIDCLFGTSESKTSIEAGWDGRTIKISYNKFKALPALLVNLLEMGQQSEGVLIGTQTAESVFPALDIIRRAGPPEEFRDKLYGIIAWYLGSRIWHVREIAARTLCSFLLKPGWLDSVADLLADADYSSNKLHGALLTLKFLLERLAEVMPDQLSDHNVSILHDLLAELASRNDCINSCLEARAVYIEVMSFIHGLSTSKKAAKPDTTTASWGLPPSWNVELSSHPDMSTAPSALLDIRLGQLAVLNALQQSNTDAGDTLSQLLTKALKRDDNVACSMLESLSSFDPPQTIKAQRELVDAYIQVCFKTDAPEPRTIALENLAALMDSLLCDVSGEGLQNLPTAEIIAQLWADLYRKPMNPSLSDAIVRVSGSLLAVIMLRSKDSARDELEQWLRSWGAIISDAGMADRTFDSRMAAVSAMRSFSSSIASSFTATGETLAPAHIPWLLALYDALNDDDDEVRAAAAAAATPLLSNQRLVSAEAGRRLLRRLGALFGDTEEFRAHIACRMTGNIPIIPLSPGTTAPTAQDSRSISAPTAKTLLSNWTPAESQLAEAMRFDDSLFVVEEQNLYVDEVREARRWSEVFSALPSPSNPSSSEMITAALSRWLLAALRSLTRAAATERADRPLGWTSKPEVYAICARALIGGAALAAAGDTEVGDALRLFWDEGRRRGVHGLLLGMCGSGVDEVVEV